MRKLLLLFVLVCWPVAASAQGRTTVIRFGSTIPAACAPGTNTSGLFFKTTSVVGLVYCDTTDHFAYLLDNTNAQTVGGVKTFSAAPVLSTLTGLLQGNGASALTTITNSTTVGQVLRVTGSNAYGWGALDLADPDAITGDIPDANLSAAVSLLGSSIDSSDLATANKTLTKDIVITSPTTALTNLAQIYWPAAVTLTKVECAIDAGTSVTLQLDERAVATPNTAGTNSLTSSLVCDATSEATTSFSDSGIASQVPHNLQITAVSGTVGAVRIHIVATVN